MCCVMARQLPLNIYCPPFRESKAYIVFRALQKGWKDGVNLIYDYTPTSGPSIFWGLVYDNPRLIREHIKKGYTWYYSDMGYFRRFTRDLPVHHYWRITKNKYVPSIIVDDLPDPDRWKRLNLSIHEWRTGGSHILVCPSSPTVNRFLGETNWTARTVALLKKHTDREIIVREKKRHVNVPLSRHLQGAHACVTLVSQMAIEAVRHGVPSFCDPRGPTAPIAETDLSKIESPRTPNNREALFNTLAHGQFTPEEIASGLAYVYLEEMGLLC